MTDFTDRLHARITELNTPALVGLDPRWDLLPEEIRDAAVASNTDVLAAKADGFLTFCCEVIDIVAPLVATVKPQIAFFEQLGPAGILAVQKVIAYARKAGLIVIADAKRGDIGSTAEAYADAWLAGEDPSAAAFAADALTVNAYLGADTLDPFVKTAKERKAGLYVLVRTSNPGATVFQDRVSEGSKLFETVANVVESLNNQYWSGSAYGSVGAVVGATWPEELQALRQRMPTTPFLVPGYGSQGGTAADVAGAFDAGGLGGVINSSRGINFAYTKEPFASDFGSAKWRDAIEAATHQMIADLRAHTPHPVA